MGLNWITIIAGSLLGLTVIIKYLRKGIKVLASLEQAVPVLAGIAKEFKSNSGSSLRDQIDNLTTASNLAVVVADSSKLIAHTNAAIVEELTGTQTTELLGIQNDMHSLRQEMTKTFLIAKISDKRTLRIEQRLDEMIPLLHRRRESYAPKKNNSDNDNS